jgi:hypothetical protein
LSPRSLDPLVGPGKQRPRDHYSKCFRSLQIGSQPRAGRKFDRQVAGRSAPRGFGNAIRRATIAPAPASGHSRWGRADDRSGHVGDTPIATKILQRRETSQCANTGFMHCSNLLFDHLIGGSKQCRRYGKAKDFCGPEIDHQLQARWLFDRKVSRFCALQDFFNVTRRFAQRFNYILPIRHQQSKGHPFQPNSITLAFGAPEPMRQLVLPRSPAWPLPGPQPRSRQEPPLKTPRRLPPVSALQSDAGQGPSL